MKYFSFTEKHMSTRVKIDVYGSKMNNGIEESIRRAFAVFADLENHFSLFSDKSELSRVNRFAGREIKVSDLFIEAALDARLMAHQSFGAFNPLHRSRMHYSKLLINKKRKTIRIPKGAVIDLNSVVKGLALDRALFCFSKSDSVMIEAGGDIVVRGTPSADARFWNIGIRNPFDVKKIIALVPLTSGAVCTSGEYFRGPHISSVNKENKSLTVIAPSAKQADILSTAAFGMPVNQAINFVENFSNCSALIVDKNGEIFIGRHLRNQYKKYYEA